MMSWSDERRDAIRTVACRLCAGVRRRRCGKKKPPVARPMPPPPPADRRRRRRARRRRREPVREPTIVPPEPVRDDAIASASLDDLNRNSPLKPVFFELDSSELSADAQTALDENAARAEAVPDLGGHDRRTLRRTRHSRVQSGIGRAARASPRAPTSCRSASPPIGCGRSATARSSRSIRATTRRRSRRTAARISSSPQSERYETDNHSQRRSSSPLVARSSAAASPRRHGRRTRNSSR